MNKINQNLISHPHLPLSISISFHMDNCIVMQFAGVVSGEFEPFPWNFPRLMTFLRRIVARNSASKSASHSRRSQTTHRTAATSSRTSRAKASWRTKINSRARLCRTSQRRRIPAHHRINRLVISSQSMVISEIKFHYWNCCSLNCQWSAAGASFEINFTKNTSMWWDEGF